MNVVRHVNHDHLRGHDRCKGDLVNPAILVTLSHHSNTHRKASKLVDVRVHQTERPELCLCVFKVALMRKALSLLSAGSTFTQHIGMLGMREELLCGL